MADDKDVPNTKDDDRKDRLSKFDKRAGGLKWPSDRDMPPLLMFKRKAVRVYPDHRKVALYYSQQIDDYLSIPFGARKNQGIAMVHESTFNPPKLGIKLNTKKPENIKASDKEWDDFEKNLIKSAKLKHSTKTKHVIARDMADYDANNFAEKLSSMQLGSQASRDLKKRLTTITARVKKEHEYQDAKESIKGQPLSYQIGWHIADKLVAKPASAIGRGVSSLASKGIDALHNQIKSMKTPIIKEEEIIKAMPILEAGPVGLALAGAGAASLPTVVGTTLAVRGASALASRAASSSFVKNIGQKIAARRAASSRASAKPSAKGSSNTGKVVGAGLGGAALASLLGGRSDQPNKEGKHVDPLLKDSPVDKSNSFIRNRKQPEQKLVIGK